MASRIRKLLRRAGKSQSDLATAIGRTPATVSRYCDGLSTPDEETAGAIADFLGVTVDDLGFREQQRRGPTSMGWLNWDVVEARLKRLGLTVVELAKRARTTRQTLYAAKARESRLRSQTLNRLAKELGTTPERLVLSDASPEE